MDKRILIIVVIVVGVFVYLFFSKKENKGNDSKTNNKSLLPNNNTPNTGGTNTNMYNVLEDGTLVPITSREVSTEVVYDTRTGLPAGNPRS